MTFHRWVQVNPAALGSLRERLKGGGAFLFEFIQDCQLVLGLDVSIVLGGDYSLLLRDDNMVGIGVVGNLGKLFTCEKVFGYNKSNALDFWNSLSIKYPDYRTDIAQRIAFAKEFLEGASHYGLTVHE